MEPLLESRTEPLRVLQVCDLQAGGIATLILGICTQLDREKVNFDYLVYRDQEEFGDAKVKELGGRKLIADNTSARNKMEKFILKFIHTWKVVNEEKPDVFHINASTPYDCLVGIAARLVGVKAIILHSHNSHLKKSGIGHCFFQNICRLLLPLCGDYYFACSDMAGEFLYGRWLQKKVIKIKNGIPTKDFRYCEETRIKMREDFQIKDELVVGHIGRFCEQKNQKFLFKIFFEICEIYPKAYLLLIGQGEMKKELVHLANYLNIRNNIIYIASTDKIGDFLDMMDVFLLPSLYEGISVAGVEAQASGLPCVFSNVIAREVALTDRAFFLSLKRPEAEWAQFVVSVVQTASRERERYADYVKNAGYEICDTAQWLQNFYLSL